MLKLKDVSKFYYNKGIIASGLTKISTEFKLGEFVVITGESGSGKSTLLNVLSGLDSYEEGEVYINGAETSHYGEAEFEVYRKKFIGNIFQNFNLVSSYSVYQNVELVLLINGYKKKEVKAKVLALLKQVDLYKFRNTKVSKLSGGQKQRVAIARALAKENPIIIADEPTGNLDSRAAVSVLETLSKIAKDKLVIIVTHNYEQVEKYATRKIKMHDGRIIEDKVLQKSSEVITPKASDYKNITRFNKLRLGLRNTFNIIPKFLLIFIVYFFVVAALLSEYSALKKLEYEESKQGYNGYFQDNSDTRIVIKKDDGTAFSDEDYQKIESLDNLSYLVKDDIILDTAISLNSKDLYLYGLIKDIKLFKGKLDVGRMPENSDEIILYGHKNDYYISQAKDELLSSDFSVVDQYTGIVNEKTKLKVVGIQYAENNVYYQFNFYVGEEILDILRADYNKNYSEIKILFASKYYLTSFWSPYMQIEPNEKVPVGKAYMSSDVEYNCPYFNCRNQKIVVTNTNMYYTKTVELAVSKTYTKNNFNSLTGLKNFNDNNGKIYVNPADYQSLFETVPYQSSVFVEDVKHIDETAAELQTMGINPLKIKDTIVKWNPEVSAVIKILRLVLTIILVVVMFFISYFIIKVILKSRNIYFSTIRILGASKKVAKQLLDIELFTIFNLAYLIIVAFILSVKYEVLNINYIQNLMTYLKITDYLIIYLVLLLMTWLIASKFAKSLFKKSAMKTYREVV